MTVNKVVYDGSTLIDLTGDTLLQANQLAKGVIAHTRTGEIIVGTGFSSVVTNYDGNGSTTARTIDTNSSADACVVTCTNGNLTALVTRTGMFYASSSTAILFKDRSVAYFEDGILYLATGQYINAAGRSYEIQVLGAAQNSVITLQPISMVVAVGETAVFTVDGGTSYQWEQNTGSGWVAINTSGGRLKTLSIAGATFRNGYQYRCVVTDANGNSEVSNMAVLCVVDSTYSVTNGDSGLTESTM